MNPKPFNTMLDESRSQQSVVSVGNVLFTVGAAVLLAAFALAPQSPASRPLQRAEPAALVDCRNAEPVSAGTVGIDADQFRLQLLDTGVDEDEIRHQLVSTHG